MMILFNSQLQLFAEIIDEDSAWDGAAFKVDVDEILNRPTSIQFLGRIDLAVRYKEKLISAAKTVMHAKLAKTESKFESFLNAFCDSVRLKSEVARIIDVLPKNARGNLKNLTLLVKDQSSILMKYWTNSELTKPNQIIKMAQSLHVQLKTLIWNCRIVVAVYEALTDLALTMQEKLPDEQMPVQYMPEISPVIIDSRAFDTIYGPSVHESILHKFQANFRQQIDKIFKVTGNIRIVFNSRQIIPISELVSLKLDSQTREGIQRAIDTSFQFANRQMAMDVLKELKEVTELVKTLVKTASQLRSS